MPVRNTTGSSLSSLPSHTGVDAQQAAVTKIMQSMTDIKNTPISKMHSVKTIVTYYQQVVDGRQGNLTNVNALNKLDPNTVSFNKVEKLALITDTLDSTMDMDESYAKINEEFDSTILPNSITPNIGDFFIMKVHNVYNIYRVGTVSPVSIEHNAGFIIHGIIYRKDIDPETFEKEIGLVNGTYVFEYEHVGTSFRTVMKKEEYDFIMVSEGVVKYAMEVYFDNFYNRTFSTILCKVKYLSNENLQSITFNPKTISAKTFNMVGMTLNGIGTKDIFDGDLIYFMNEYNLFYTTTKSILSNYTSGKGEFYRNSVFHALVLRDVSKLTSLNSAIALVDKGNFNQVTKIYGKYITNFTNEDIKPYDLGHGVIKLIPQIVMNRIKTYNKDTFNSYNGSSSVDIMGIIISTYLNEPDYNIRFNIIFKMMSRLSKDKILLDIDSYDSGSDILYLYPFISYIVKSYISEISSKEF